MRDGIGVGILVAGLGWVTVAQGAPVHLRTDAMVTPMGVDTARPTFSWRSDAVRPNWMQSAYEVRVASSAEGLGAGKADAWDSGRVASSESVGVVYAGVALWPQQRYVWTVRTWDEQGKESVSEATWFETGLTGADSWKAEWIRREDPVTEKEIGGGALDVAAGGGRDACGFGDAGTFSVQAEFRGRAHGCEPACGDARAVYGAGERDGFGAP